MKKSLQSYFNICIFLLFLISSDSFSQTIFSVQDGNWEDSATWNTQVALADTIAVDTIKVFHHVTFNDSLRITNCVFVLDTNASICGHYNVHLRNSTVYSYGQFYTHYLKIDGSHFYDWYGMLIFSCGAWIGGGIGSNLQIHGGGAKTLWDYDCSFPPTSWYDPYMCGATPPDTTSEDTIKNIVIEPIVINVNPNPFMYQFCVRSEIPDSAAKVSLNIYDLLGREMQTISIPNGKSAITIFTYDWSAGMYLLRFMNGERQIKEEKLVRVQ